MNIGPMSYTGNLPWLAEGTILFTYHGSRAYGLDTPSSDTDFKGVAVPPKSYFVGLDRFEQAEFKDVWHPRGAQKNDAEAVIYEIRKFIGLAGACNPNIIEVLWTDPAHHVVCTPAGQRLVDNRHLFLSKKARFTFSGYAHSQLKRIKTHYDWICYGADKQEPKREHFGLPERTLIPADQLAAAEAEIQKKLDTWNLKGLEEMDPAARVEVISVVSKVMAEMRLGSEDSKWLAAARTVGLDDNFIQLMNFERRYKAAHKEWEAYQTWMRTRNPARAELERKHGYDTKHAMHLVRLMRMCTEILEEGTVKVKRDEDREELMAIREGAWTYTQLVRYAEEEDRKMEARYKASKLPHSTDIKALNRLCTEIVSESIF